MAFAATNVQTGSMGSKKFTCGDWTGSLTDGSGTIGVAGGRVWLCEFNSMPTSGPYMERHPTSYSTSGTVSTVTVYYPGETVTAGTFYIIHG